MNKRIFTAFIAMFLVTAFAFAGASFGEGIKERMASRLPALEQLKAKGIIGENNQGYLEFRGSSREGQDLVNAENADRKQVYAYIAQKQGTTPELVGQRRAIQLGERADPGHWLQNAEGQWYQK
ncbi:YdbL family protein [Desulfatibacillum aliphaticivorans]|uniref:YdbL family protein n=1 Tax=Desulfatibacillum aliphaticivorans TaxID=218208 RepID=UPI000423CE7A|nr:YdbL family protein [Desulfatibacillum aliphaticivorans]